MESLEYLFSNMSVVTLKLQVLRKLWAKYRAKVGRGMENAQF